MSGTLPFSPDQAQLFLGTPLDNLQGTMSVLMLRSRYYIDGTLKQKGTSPTVTKEWGQAAIAHGWAKAIDGSLPMQEGPAFKEGAVLTLATLAGETRKWQLAAPNGLQVFPGNAPNVVINGGASGLTSGASGDEWIATATGNSSGHIEFQWHSLPDSFSGDAVVLEYAIDPTTISQAAIFISETSAYSVYGLATRAHTTPADGSQINHTGTQAWCAAEGTFSKNGYSRATQEQVWGVCKVRFSIVNGQTATIRLRAMRVGTQAEYGRLAVVCDDGYKSFYQLALPVFEDFGIPVTFSIIPSLIGTGNFMTETMLQDLVARGHDIVPHGPVGGSGDLFSTHATDEAAIADVIATRDWINARGLNPRGAADICYVWPQGNYARTAGDSSFLDRMTAQGFRIGRVASPGSTLTAIAGRSVSRTSQSRLVQPIIGHTYAGATNTADDATETTNITTITGRITDLQTQRKDGFLMLHSVVKRGAATAGGLGIEMDRLVTLATAIRDGVLTGRLMAVRMAQLLP